MTISLSFFIPIKARSEGGFGKKTDVGDAEEIEYHSINSPPDEKKANLQKY